jgi:ribosomal protein L9
VGRDLVADWLLQQGFSVDEIYEIWNNLKSYASQVRRVFADVDGLHVKVKKLLQEEAKLHSQVNKIYWSISLKRIAEELKKKGIQ